MNNPGEPPGWSESGSEPEELAGGFADGERPTAEPEPEPGPERRSHLRALSGGRDRSAAAEPATVDDQPIAEGPPADFRVRCPDCGPQYVAVADVRFVSTGGGADTDRYLFTCPACGLRVRRPAGPELAQILKTSGVATLALHRRPDQAL